MNYLSEILTDNIGKLSKITLGSTGLGTIAQYMGGQFMYLDLLSIMQYTAYAVSIIVGILTIVAWFRKQKNNK